MDPVRVSTIPPLEEAGDGAVEESSDGAAVAAGGAVVAGDADAAGPQPSTNAPRMAPMTRVRMSRAPAMTHRVYACVQASGGTLHRCDSPSLVARAVFRPPAA